MNSLFDFTVTGSDGTPYPLSKHSGQAVLIVNVASKCGFTPQYEGLEQLYKKYSGSGFIILGFPCNQFGAQEPGTDSEIQEFCSMNYGVTFPVLGKVDVNGANASPVFEFLKKGAPGLMGTEAVKWNFTKFLVGRDGKVIDRYAPQTEPKALAKDIERAIETK